MHHARPTGKSVVLFSIINGTHQAGDNKTQTRQWSLFTQLDATLSVNRSRETFAATNHPSAVTHGSPDEPYRVQQYTPAALDWPNIEVMRFLFAFDGRLASCAVVSVGRTLYGCAVIIKGPIVMLQCCNLRVKHFSLIYCVYIKLFIFAVCGYQSRTKVMSLSNPGLLEE